MICSKATLPEVEKELLKEQFGFTQAEFKKWSIQNNEIGTKLASPELDAEQVEIMTERGKLIYKLYQLCKRYFVFVLLAFQQFLLFLHQVCL